MMSNTLGSSTPAGQISWTDSPENPGIQPKPIRRRDNVHGPSIAISYGGGSGSPSTTAPQTGTMRNTFPPSPEQGPKLTARTQSIDTSSGSADFGTPSTPSVSDVQMDLGPAIPFKDVTTAFAVDISWSTGKAGILEQEKKAVRDLSEHLSTSSTSQARILPWNSSAHRPTMLSNISMLHSSGGTDPTVLNRDPDYQKILQTCSLWFLLTDGEIDQYTVKEFALQIGERGLHGKACVVVLFGTRPYRPIKCNISVGQAIFAVAPHCAFLFHDVDTEEVFVLQCKGGFRELLPQANMEIFLNHDTDWKDLPLTTYDNLAQIPIPQPRQVANNAIFLAGGKVVSLEDLYNNRLSPSIAAEILNNDDDLKSILLTAQNRGKSREIEAWVSKQRVSRKATEYINRPDLDGNACKLVKRLVSAMKSQSRDSILEAEIKPLLREAHRQNWVAFINSTKSTIDQMAQRNTVVDDALNRVKLNRTSPGSPSMMSPVSPQPRGSGSQKTSSQPPAQLIQRPNQTSSDAPSVRYLAHADLPNRSRTFQSQSPTNPAFYTALERPSQPYRTSPHSHALSSRMGQLHASQAEPLVGFPYNADLSHLLYMKGYKLGSGPASAEAFHGHCSLCEDDNAPLALLLKTKPADYITEGGFPIPNSHAEIKFPLAMGNFPETDILSEFICCEKCAHFIRALGTSPIDDSITGAVPLVPLSNEMNRDSVLKEIDTALEQRFNVSILDQIFLSILYNKLDNITTDNFPNSELLISVLRWQCRNFTGQISIPASLSSSFDPAEELIYSPLSTAMSAVLPSIDTTESNSLVQYPIDGFITLLKCFLDLNLGNPTDNTVRKAVFQRFLFHLAEQQAALREDIGADGATRELRRILSGETSGLITDSFVAEVEALEGTYLFEEDAFESFRRLKDVFAFVERTCGVAIRLFLELLVETEGRAIQEGREDLNGFEVIKEKYAASLLFTAPWELREEGSREILESGR